MDEHRDFLLRNDRVQVKPRPEDRQLEIEHSSGGLAAHIGAHYMKDRESEQAA